jgi:hypothetical protein
MARRDSQVRCLAVLLLAAGLGGCATLPEEVHLSDRFASADTAYGALLPEFTRKAELYDKFDTVAKAWATWRSPELRRALVETTILAYRLEGATAETLRLEQDRAARRIREFHLALYTPRKDWNDLESSDTLWRAYLYLPDGDRLEPVQVIYLPKSDKSAVEYPYVSRWTREYSLFFPLLGEAETREHLTLVLSGPLGTMRFAY